MGDCRALAGPRTFYCVTLSSFSSDRQGREETDDTNLRGGSGAAIAALSLTSPHGVVRSKPLTKWLAAHGIDWGEEVGGFKGRYLNEVDKIVCRRDGRLQRWKKDPASIRSAVGWSLADAVGHRTRICRRI